MHNCLKCRNYSNGQGAFNILCASICNAMRVQSERIDPSRDEFLDGIDLDFEGISSQAEWKDYLNFISTASAYLHDNNLLLTVALHPGMLLSAEMCQSIDRVHVMTYDMAATSERGAVESNNYHAHMSLTHDAIYKFVQNGCHASKLVLGIPAYARKAESPGDVKTYSEVVDQVMDQPVIKQRNAEERNELLKTILASMRKFRGYQFEAQVDVEEKVRYAHDNGLGGVFFWELGQDKQLAGVAEGGILLETAAAFFAKFSDRGKWTAPGQDESGDIEVPPRGGDEL